ncbi:MAG TPA: DNA ligase D [Ferrovibrio sp.]|uniref:DNA ligase D n=1 Tax=Ferrovibrio sp. TaxID=1917215 RepID=UPI002ED25EA6
MAKQTLATYRRKRDFSQTGEPSGTGKRRRLNPGGLSYVIQKHAARRLHYDFRLEYDGVLKSWAVPKGPSRDPSVKRLAVQVEDHPIDYGDFEGTIPKGQYGGGTVQLWDRGTWEPEDPQHVGEALKKGRLTFELHGERLKGRWNLVRGGGRYGKDGKKNWLLIKGHDDFAAENGEADLDKLDRSVKTGRSMTEIATGNSAVWHSNRAKQAEPAKPARKAKGKARPPARRRGNGGKTAAMPGFIAPQLATLQEEAPSGEGWGHEIKLDGYRIQLHVENGDCIAYTRSGLDWSSHFPEIVAAAAQALPDCILDGEIAALDGEGRSDFAALQSALERDATAQLVYFAFDLLHAGGKDWRGAPLEQRKAALQDLLAGHEGRIRFSEHLVGDGPGIRRSACEMGLEGLVSKRLSAPYRSGRFSSWIKSKCRNRQEFVVGGFIRRKGGNPLTGLVVGTYDGDVLRYRGRVGTGYNARIAADLLGRLGKLKRKTSPFASAGAQPEKPGEIEWVRPELVVEVEFASWTSSGVLRQASFKGLREDKAAPEVRTEMPTRVAANASGAAKAGAGKAKAATVSNPEKLLWPADGVSKQDLADYYARFADHLLPHLVGRPISLIRAPDGIEGETFFQRHYAKGMPAGIQPAKVRNEKQPYLMIKHAGGLQALAQYGVVEIHPWGAKSSNIEKPDLLIFDFDPDEGLGFAMIKRAVLAMHGHLESFGLNSFVKLTGGKGVHVVAPLKPGADWEMAKGFTKAIAENFAEADPDNFTATMSKRRRKGRIFVDYLRNAKTSTAVAPWSPRGRPGAPIAVPVTWEFFAGLRQLPVYSMTRLQEVERHFDAWKDFNACRATLTKTMLKKAGLG